MSRGHLLPFLGLLKVVYVFASLLSSVLTQPGCCPRKTIDAGTGVSGTFVLSTSALHPGDFGCKDSCVYKREEDGLSYCFKSGGSYQISCDSETNLNSTPVTANENLAITDSSATEATAIEDTAALNARYCAIDPEHTMCKYPGPSAECSSKTLVRGLSEPAKQAILDRHNELRQQVAEGKEANGPQPQAANMKKLVWNDELAVIAQRWADQCTYDHDSNKDKEDKTKVGQNIFESSNTKQLNEDEVNGMAAVSVDDWYNEVRDPGFSSKHIKPFVYEVAAAHYTQLVWAKTEELGCGMVYYQKDEKFKNIQVVCNYAEKGNIQGGSVYAPGKPCSKCLVGYTCQQSLCAKP